MAFLRTLESFLFGPEIHSPVILANSIASIFHALAVFALALALSYTAFHFLQTKGREFVKATKTRIDDTFLELFTGFEAYFGVIFGAFLSWKMLDLPDALDRVIEAILLILTTIGATWILTRVATEGLRAILLMSPNLQKQRQKIYPTLSRFLNILIWIVALTFILSKLGVNVTSIVAGLGIGGLAVALAGQETLANFFGSLAVLSDRPFAIDDLVEIDGVRGTVEDIGMRSTKIRLLNGTLLTIPNKKVSESTVDNYSRRVNVRIDLELNFPYETTTEKLEAAQGIIQRALRSIEGVDREVEPWVYFLRFGTAALTYKVTYWTIAHEEWSTVLAVQHRVNIALKRDLEAAGLTFAYPTQVVYLKKTDA